MHYFLLEHYYKYKEQMATKNVIPIYNIQEKFEKFAKYPESTRVNIICSTKQAGGYLVRGIGPRNIRVISNGSIVKTKPPKMDVILVRANDDDLVDINTYFINTEEDLCFCKNPTVS